MKRRELHFVTTNANKLRELSAMLRQPLRQTSLDIAEIQTTDLEELVEYKLRKAYESIKQPVIVEDTSLYFEAWNGLPGPLVKWFVEHLGPRGMAKALSGFENHRARAVCCLGYTPDGNARYFFKGEVRGRIVSPRGSFEFGWDPIFQPDGAAQTFGEMNSAEKQKLSMRGRAAAEFNRFLAEEEGRKVHPPR